MGAGRGKPLPSLCFCTNTWKTFDTHTHAFFLLPLEDTHFAFCGRNRLSGRHYLSHCSLSHTCSPSLVLKFLFLSPTLHTFPTLTFDMTCWHLPPATRLLYLCTPVSLCLHTCGMYMHHIPPPCLLPTHFLFSPAHFLTHTSLLTLLSHLFWFWFHCTTHTPVSFETHTHAPLLRPSACLHTFSFIQALHYVAPAVSIFLSWNFSLSLSGHYFSCCLSLLPFFCLSVPAVSLPCHLSPVYFLLFSLSLYANMYATFFLPTYGWPGGHGTDCIWDGDFSACLLYYTRHACAFSAFTALLPPSLTLSFSPCLSSLSLLPSLEHMTDTHTACMPHYHH